MRYLLDTHTWLWMLHRPERLGPSISIVEDPTNDLVVSAVTTWEIAIKVSLGRLLLPEHLESYLQRQMVEQRVESLAVDTRHALRVADLPLHHRDPFDRMLIAQAQVERLPIMTADRVFDAYDCEVIRVGS